VGPRPLWCRCGFSFEFSFFKSKCCRTKNERKKIDWLWLGGGGIAELGTFNLKKPYHHSGPSHMKPNELWTRPHNGVARAQAPSCHRSSCRFVRTGKGGDRSRYSQRCSQGGDCGSRHLRLFKGAQGKEVRRRFSIVGACPLAQFSRANPGTVTIPQYRFNTTTPHKAAPWVTLIF